MRPTSIVEAPSILNCYEGFILDNLNLALLQTFLKGSVAQRTLFKALARPRRNKPPRTPK